MYYLYHGTDIPKVRKSALELAEKMSEGTYSTVGEEVSEAALQELLGATSLFRDKEVFVLDTLSRFPESFEILASLLWELKASPNVFIVIEEKLGAKEEKKMSEYAEKTVSYARAESKEFNVFALTDALLLRDKKALWILLTEAWRSGKSSEEIIGTLMWQLKAIRLSALTSGASESGLKPFVYEKAKRALKKFSPEEVDARAHELVRLYHEGHAGKRDIDLALEQWVLRL